MNGCENYQMNLSALMDGELENEELADTIQHLAACAACLKEFQTFQALQKKVNHEVKTPALPSRLWNAIAQKGSVPSVAMSRPLRPTVMRVLRMAAVVILCFGLGYAMSKPIFKKLSYDPKSPIVLASNSGSMTEDRFLEMTRELLTADPTYHRKMYLILSLLIERYGEGNLQSLKEAETPMPIAPIVERNNGQVETYRF